MRQPDGMGDAARDLLDQFSEEDLDVDQQITNLEELIRDSNPIVILEKISIGMNLSAHLSSLDIPDDGLGLGPDLSNFVIGKVFSSSEYGDNEPSYADIALAASKVEQAYCFSDLAELDPDSMSDEEIEQRSLSFFLKLRELSSSRFLYHKQVEEAARRSYSPHQAQMQRAVGFNINQAIDFVKYIQKMITIVYNDQILPQIDFTPSEAISGTNFYESMIDVYQETGEFENPIRRTKILEDGDVIDDVHSQVSQFRKSLWPTSDFLLRNLPDDQDTDSFRRFLERMSYNIHSDSSDFRHIDEFNSVHGQPLAYSGDGYLAPNLRTLRYALMDTFYYDLSNLEGYGDPEGDTGGEFGNIWGEYVEEWSYDSLKMVFPESSIYLNPHYRTDDGSWEEAADVVVSWENCLIVFECKSKKLVLPSRGGSYGSATDDLERGIGEATNQANTILSILEDQEELEIECGNSHTTLINSDYKYRYPVVVLGEQYDMVGIDLFEAVLDLPQLPWVTSVYDLQVICDLLSPWEFISYISQRPRITRSRNVRAVDEVDLLGWFVVNDYTFPEVPEDQFMMVMDYSYEVAKWLDFKYGP